MPRSFCSKRWRCLLLFPVFFVVFLYQQEDAEKEATIFVSIASYQDPLCPATIDSVFKASRFPHRIFLGVVEFVRNVSFCAQASSLRSRPLQIQSMMLPITQAKGPAYSRFLVSKLLGNQKYFLLIDSHTMFTENWDSSLIFQLHQAERISTRAVLSKHPAPWYPQSSLPVTQVSKDLLLCGAIFNVDVGVPAVFSRKFRHSASSLTPIRQPYTCAGFLFMRTTTVRVVPFDPQLTYVYHGEEILYTARLYTHGYDSFSPQGDAVFHYYDRPTSERWTPPGWNQPVDGTEFFLAEQQQGLRRIQSVLRVTAFNSTVPLSPSISLKYDRYGLGQERSLNQFWEYAGVNMKLRRVNATKWGCDE